MRPTTAAEAIAWANDDPPRAGWYVTSCGRVELALTLDDARSGYHSGPCDDDVAELLKVPYVAQQLDAIPHESIREELREYGTWTADELADVDACRARILWLACGDVVEASI